MHVAKFSSRPRRRTCLSGVEQLRARMASRAAAPALALVTAFLGLSHALPGLLDPSGTMPTKRLQIVGGSAADIKDYGHQVSWQPGGSHRCGGSILSPEWVLTAAHCLKGPDGEAALMNTSIVAGVSMSIPSKAHKGQTVHVIELHAHPHFDPMNYTNDIALLKVTPHFVNETGVHPIPIIAAGGPPNVNDTVIVTGWGQLNEFSYRASTVLQKVKVLVRDTEDCRRKFADTISLPDTVLCASAPGKDSCQGDSGGPLIYRGADEKEHLVGVVSAGIGCAHKEYPGIYTDLRNLAMRAFIRNVTGIQL